MFNVNLPQLDLIVKTLVQHDERMAQLLQQIARQFSEATAALIKAQASVTKPTQKR